MPSSSLPWFLFVNVGVALTITSAAFAKEATVQICDAPAEGQSAHLASSFFSADGTLQHLAIVARGDATSNCEAISLPGVPAHQVRWVGPVEPGMHPDALQTLVLRGQFSDAVNVSEIIADSSPMPPTRTWLPFNRAALHAFGSQPFGIEERARLHAPDQLVCAPGEKAAGVFYRSAQRWLASSPMTLSVRAQGSGQVEVAIGDSHRDQQEAPLSLGSMTLTEQAQDFLFEVPGNARRWSSLTFLCPPEGATLTLQDVRMLPKHNGPQRRAGAWFWSPDLWQQTPDKIIGAVIAESLKELYITVPVHEDRVAEPGTLSAFIERAERHGLSVWAVVGDPRDVLTESWPALQQRLRAFRHYNESRAGQTRLAGVQLDIEPYLLPGFAQNHSLWRARYVDTVRMAQDEIAGSMPIDLVVPSWWGIHAHWGERLFDALDWSGTRMTVMNYHTDPERLRHDAEPFLSWAQHHDAKIRIALETGTLPDETQLRFARTPHQGDLWIVAVADTPVLVLLDRPRSGLPGIAFSHQDTNLVPASRHTFAGDPDRLAAVAAAMESHWQQWSSYGGLSLHGLDEYLNRGDKTP